MNGRSLLRSHLHGEVVARFVDDDGSTVCGIRDDRVDDAQRGARVNYVERALGRGRRRDRAALEFGAAGRFHRDEATVRSRLHIVERGILKNGNGGAVDIERAVRAAATALEA